MSFGELLPAHGFVLAGGKSSRMGQDKALLSFSGRPMVEIAVARLRRFCTAVSIAGNRDDLKSIAPVVPEARLESGPAAGIEAGLHSASERWALFTPVDVPLVPELLLRNWLRAVLSREEEGVRLSYLRANGERQPTFCLMRSDCKDIVTAVVERGERKLGVVFDEVASVLGSTAVWMTEAEGFAAEEDAINLETWFSNVNTPEDLSALELWLRRADPMRQAAT